MLLFFDGGGNTPEKALSQPVTSQSPFLTEDQTQQKTQFLVRNFLISALSTQEENTPENSAFYLEFDTSPVATEGKTPQKTRLHIGVFPPPLFNEPRNTRQNKAAFLI